MAMDRNPAFNLIIYSFKIKRNQLADPKHKENMDNCTEFGVATRHKGEKSLFCRILFG